MTLQQEITLAAKEAFEEGYKKASEEAEKALKKVSEEKENVLKKAEMEKELAVEKEKLENARKLKESGVSVEIISKCKAFPWSRFGNCKVIFTDWHVK